MPRSKLSGPEIARLWIDAGGPRKYARTMAAIALRESGGRVRIDNRGLNKDGSVDTGLFQINSIHGHPQDKLRDPVYNARAAVKVFKSQGLGAWSVYNAGTWKHALPQVKSIAPPVRERRPRGSAPPRESAPAEAAQPRSALLAAVELAAAPRAPVSAPPSVTFDARRALALPGGYTGTVASAPPATRGPSISQALAAATALRGPDPPSAGTPAGASAKPPNATRAPRAGSSPKLRASGARGGTAQLARSAQRVAKGFNVTGLRTPQQNASVGGAEDSDHLTSNPGSYALDFSDGSKTETKGKEALARKLAAHFGVKFVKNSFSSGGVIKVNGRRYRLQLLYGGDPVLRHADHVHLGIRAL